MAFQSGTSFYLTCFEKIDAVETEFFSPFIKIGPIKREDEGVSRCLTGRRENYKIFLTPSRCGSMVEQRIRNAQVSGSNPLAGSIGNG